MSDRAEKLQRLIDIDEIRQLTAVYNMAFDNRDGEGYIACWTEDGYTERKGTKPQCRGHAQLKVLAEQFPVECRHMTTDMIIEIDGDKATGKNYMVLLDMHKGGEVSMMGIYYDKLVRTEDGWKFKERIFDALCIRESEQDEEFNNLVVGFEKL